MITDVEKVKLLLLGLERDYFSYRTEVTYDPIKSCYIVNCMDLEEPMIYDFKKLLTEYNELDVKDKYDLFTLFSNEIPTINLDNSFLPHKYRKY